MHRGGTLSELARAAGIDPSGLQSQVAEWNAASAVGEDVRFGRGGNVYDSYYGDSKSEFGPNFGPLKEPPFFAVELFSGTIGSKGGALTNADSLSIRRDGTVMNNLAFVGNASVPWIGAAYPGPGATLAVCMVAALRAAQALSDRPAR